MFKFVDVIENERFLRRSAFNFLLTYSLLSIFAIYMLQLSVIAKTLYISLIAILTFNFSLRLKHADMETLKRVNKTFVIIALLLIIATIYIPIAFRNIALTVFASTFLLYNFVFIAKFIFLSSKIEKKRR